MRLTTCEMAHTVERMKKMVHERTGLAQRLIARRQQLGMHQHAVYTAAGVSARAYAAMELGENNPQLSALKRVATVLQISLDELLGHERWPKRLRHVEIQQDVEPLSKAG